jgi:hypothetical protein
VSQLPMQGNLAWAPVPAIENVEVLDRFNGVPTLGLYSAGDDRVLFWRALGYVPSKFSIWLYVPVDGQAEQHLSCSEPDDMLTGLLFESPLDRYVTVGIASRDYRLVFEREWKVPSGLSAASVIGALLNFLNEALDIMLQQDLPPTRREMIGNASRAVRELASASS